MRENRMGRRRALVASLVTVFAGAAVVVGTAIAATGAAPVAGGLAAPWGITVTPNGNLLVVEAGKGSIVEVTPQGGVTSRGSGLGESLSDVAIAGRPNKGKSLSAWHTGYLADGSLWRLVSSGKGVHVADLAAFEAANNPDADNEYGPVLGTSPEGCDVPEALVYSGIIESNAYGLTGLGDGSFLVADAAGNDVLRVEPGGRTSVVAVLPPVESELTAAAIGEYNAAVTRGDIPPPAIPECAEGMKWRANPVPTSTAIGPDGALYVGGLTGFPEEPGNGVVFRVEPGTGEPEIWAGGLTFVVDIAFTPDGSLVVAELFGGTTGSTGPGLVTRIATTTAGGELVAGARSTLALAVTNGFMTPLGVAVTASGDVYATGGELFGPGGVWKVG